MLVLEGVRKSYVEPDGRLLDVLDIPAFRLESGEQVALMGSSGSGKSTLLNLIAGILTPDRGRIQVDAVDLARLPEPARDRFRARRIGYVFQTFNLLLGFSALENVLMSMLFGGAVDRDRARSLLDRVGLGHRIHHRPAALSVGEQQRVAIARAVANQPTLLLADEPTAHLDDAHRDEVLGLIREVCEEDGVALLLVTHSTEVAAQFPTVHRLADLNRLEGDGP